MAGSVAGKGPKPGRGSPPTSSSTLHFAPRLPASPNLGCFRRLCLGQREDLVEGGADSVPGFPSARDILTGTLADVNCPLRCK